MDANQRAITMSENIPQSMSWVSPEFRMAASNPSFRKRRYKKTGTTIWQCASLQAESDCPLLGKINVDGNNVVFAFQLQAWLTGPIADGIIKDNNILKQLVFAVSEDGNCLVLDDKDRVWMFDHESRALSLEEESFANWMENSSDCHTVIKSQSSIPTSLVGKWRAISSQTLPDKVLERFPQIIIEQPSTWTEIWKDAHGERVVIGFVIVAEESSTILKVSIRDTFMTFTWKLLQNGNLILTGPDSSRQVSYQREAYH
jgi:hypothetical protein